MSVTTLIPSYSLLTKQLLPFLNHSQATSVEVPSFHSPHSGSHPYPYSFFHTFFNLMISPVFLYLGWVYIYSCLARLHRRYLPSNYHHNLPNHFPSVPHFPIVHYYLPYTLYLSAILPSETHTIPTSFTYFPELSLSSFFLAFLFGCFTFCCLFLYSPHPLSYPLLSTSQFFLFFLDLHFLFICFLSLPFYPSLFHRFISIANNFWFFLSILTSPALVCFLTRRLLYSSTPPASRSVTLVFHSIIPTASLKLPLQPTFYFFCIHIHLFSPPLVF